MNKPRFRYSLGLFSAFALSCVPSGFADTDHAADDEFAAAAAALAPKFDPERDAITIEKITAQQGKAKKVQARYGKAAKGNVTTKEVLPPATGPAARGTWGSVIAWTPHIPVTASVLPNGKLLTFASNQRTTFPGGPEFTYAAVWDPATGQFTEVNNNRHDMFCGGTALLPDGRLVINGGRNTTRLSSIFNWQTNQWSALPNMNDPSPTQQITAREGSASFAPSATPSPVPSAPAVVSPKNTSSPENSSTSNGTPSSLTMTA